MTDTLHWIWFQLMFGFGSRRAHALMEYFESPGDIIDGIETKNRVITMLREEEILSWEKKFAVARDIQRRTQSKGCEIITPEHPDYPPLLLNIFSKPAALYVKGDLSCLRETIVIAMVGTRAYTDYGKEAGVRLAGGLAQRGAVVVSGLAKGIDSICHQAALDAGGKSVGVLGCGIDVAYPSGSAKLKRAISENGAVITEFPLGFEPHAGHFPLRNRIISGMSDGTVVVEADVKSGSIITATHAAEQGREIFAVPGSIFSDREQGTHQLIKDGAKLTQTVEDILDEFSHREYPAMELVNPRKQSPPKEYLEMQKLAKDPQPQPDAAKRRDIPEELSSGAREIHSLIKETPVGFEEIAAGTTLSVGDIQSALTELEIYGLIKGHPGRRFSL